MPTIKKVKRDALAELGDEWTVLTDAEVSDSGLSVEADEAIVVANPPPSQPPNGGGSSDEVNTLRGRVHTANQEAASRRIALRQAEAREKALQDRVAELEKESNERKLADTKSNAQSLFTEYVKDKKLTFVSAEAGEDVRDAAFAQVDWTKPVTKEIIGPLVDGIVDKKKYVLKTVELPPTDGGKPPSLPDGNVVVDDAMIEQVAREFNIPYKTKKE